MLHAEALNMKKGIESMQAELKIEKRKLEFEGAETWAHFLTLGGKEGWCSAEAQVLLGYETSNALRKAARDLRIDGDILSSSHLKVLREQQVISLNVGRQTFYSKDQIWKLAKRSTSTKAEAFCKFAFNFTDASMRGDVKAVSAMRAEVLGEAAQKKPYSAADLLGVFQQLQQDAEDERRLRLIAEQRAFVADGRSGGLQKANNQLRMVVSEKDAALSDKDSTIFHQDTTIFALQKQLEERDSYCVPGEWLSLRPTLTPRYTASTLGKALKAFATKNGFKPLARTTSGSTSDGKSWTNTQPTYSSACVDAFISTLN